jgi:diguanylate cyclase (GGDEF)-like protein/PAS domain S-box-containing protein
MHGDNVEGFNDSLTVADPAMGAGAARSVFAFHSVSASLILAGVVFFITAIFHHPKANLAGLLVVAGACVVMGITIRSIPNKYKQLDDLSSLVSIGTILIAFAEVFSYQYSGAYHIVLVWPFVAGAAFLTRRYLVSTAILTMVAIFAAIVLQANMGDNLSSYDIITQIILLYTTMILVSGILRLVESRLISSQRELEKVFSSSSGGLALIAQDNRLTRANDIFCQLLGFTMTEAIGKDVSAIIYQEDDPSWVRRLNWLKQGRIPEIATDQRFVRADGEVFWARIRTSLMPDGTIFLELHELQGVGVTASRRAVRAASELDDLTQIASRSEVVKQVTSFLVRSSASNIPTCILLMDLDRFSEINESLGHEKGDLALIAVAERLATRVDPPEILGRLSADRFVVVFPACKDEKEALVKANKFMHLFEEPFNSVASGLVLGVTAGMALSLPGTSPTSLLRDAEIALKKAKERRRGGVSIFESTMRKSAELRVVRESELRAAVGRQEFIVYYQPIVDVITGEVNALEALVRWQHPTRGIVMPGDFIPLAEELGLTVLIDEIGKFVLGRAVADLIRFRKANPKAARLRMCVNMSAYQLSLGRELVEDVTDLMSKADIGKGELELELTESMLMNDPMVPETLSLLRKAGADVVLDDFGTGYSSLSYLSQYPVDVVKVDQSFVAELGMDARAEALVRAIVDMASALGLRLIAEGAETLEQLSLLREMGCKYVQGYLFSRPHPAKDIVPMLDGFDMSKFTIQDLSSVKSGASREVRMLTHKEDDRSSSEGEAAAAGDTKQQKKETENLQQRLIDNFEFDKSNKLAEDDDFFPDDDPDGTDPDNGMKKRHSRRDKFTLRHSA